MAEYLQFAGRRLMVCGMHVHIGIEDPEMRVVVLNGIREHLPLLLALSTSSPFWEGEDTGLKSVRPMILDDLPRSGPPDRFKNHAAYASALSSLVDTGIIPDASHIWWDARLSAKWPTVEIRMMDIMPRVHDALAMASFCRCLCRMVWRQHMAGETPDLAPRMVVMENRWRALRFGFEATFVEHGKTELVSATERIRAVCDEVSADGDFFGCCEELRHLLHGISSGTSADRQISLHKQSLADGAAGSDALCPCVKQVLAETIQDIDFA